MARKLVDRLGQIVNLGDHVVYGANRGLVIGVIVKWNPNTFQIRSSDLYNNGLTNIPYGYKDCLVRTDSLANFNHVDLTDEEKARIDLDRKVRSI